MFIAKLTAQLNRNIYIARFTMFLSGLHTHTHTHTHTYIHIYIYIYIYII